MPAVAAVTPPLPSPFSRPFAVIFAWRLVSVGCTWSPLAYLVSDPTAAEPSIFGDVVVAAGTLLVGALSLLRAFTLSCRSFRSRAVNTRAHGVFTAQPEDVPSQPRVTVRALPLIAVTRTVSDWLLSMPIVRGKGTAVGKTDASATFTVVAVADKAPDSVVLGELICPGYIVARVVISIVLRLWNWQITGPPG